MLQKSLLFLILLVFVNINSQTSTSLAILESPEYSDQYKSKNILSIHTTKSGYTGIIRESKKHFLFDIFDKDLKKVFFQIIEKEKREDFAGELFHGDEIKFFTVYSPKKTERILYCHTINLKEKTYKKVSLFEKTVTKKHNLFSGRKRHHVNFTVSENGDYFALAADNIKKSLNSHTIYVYNSKNLELLFKKEYGKNGERYFEHNDISIDNNGIVYTLGKVFAQNVSIQTFNEKPNYTFSLNKITKDSISNLNINGTDKHIESLSISGKNDQLHLIGFYSDKNVGRIKGGYNFIIDPDQLSIVDTKMHELPIEVYENLYGYRKAEKKKNKELTRFNIDYVIEDDAGNTFLLAEEFFITTNYVNTGNMGGHWQTVYHYNDVIILKYNVSGKLDWASSIFKRAHTHSYNAFIKGDELHVILNSGENLKEKKDGRIKASKGFFESTALYDFEYSKEGEVSYNKIQNNRANTLYLPNHGTFENETFIMMSSGKRKKQFMILK
ncbi:hypothetical protein [uncultured Aquimarina sp.]|uniref:hypothetical protein n=1 Tax=uncultured Aquimarina sp. TaxID=575652 RepID=UPI00261F8D25|nr:hypothetical protein [uncultured Aquimarina sp.]